MTTQFNRRILLRGLGGAVVAAPFLSSLFERTAKAQAAVVPKRTIVMFSHYGCITNKWFPAKLDGELTAADLTGTSLEVLAPFAKKLLMPRGHPHHERVDGEQHGRRARPRSGQRLAHADRRVDFHLPAGHLRTVTSRSTSVTPSSRPCRSVLRSTT